MTEIDIPIDKYEGYIFDMDGTVVDTMPLHFQAWTETVASESGQPSVFSEALFYSFAGRPPREIVASLNETYGLEMKPLETAAKKETRFLEILHHAGEIKAVVDYIKRLPADTPKAIASGGDTHVVRTTLEEHGLLKYFPVVIGSDQVSRGKPDPELFLKTAAELGVEPSRCIVFEDGPAGFVAAEAAGMDFIDVRPYYWPEARWELVKAAETSG